MGVDGKRHDSEMPGCAGESCGAAAELFNGEVPAGLTGVGRRTFLVQSALMTAAAMLAACGGSSDLTAPPITTGGSTGSGSGSSSNNVLTLANYPSLASVGGVALINIGNAPIAVVRTGTSSFVALSRICPHQGGLVQPTGSGFQCPIHGATFNQTGTWIGGQRTSSLHAYTTSYDATAGTLTIT